MKIRTQDADKYLYYGEAYVENRLGHGVVYVRNQYHTRGIPAGIYEDAIRASGVLYEMGLAYQSGQKVFYMPAV